MGFSYMRYKIRQHEFTKWVLLSAVFGSLTDRYFQGALHWPAHDNDYHSYSSSNIPLAITKWGLALITIICLWKASGIIARSRVQRVLYLGLVSIILVIIGMVYVLATFQGSF